MKQLIMLAPAIALTVIAAGCWGAPTNSRPGSGKW